MLSGRVAFVSGIAIQLGAAGATVYASALKPGSEDEIVKKFADRLPTLEDTISEIKQRGGHGIPIYCDHAKPEQTHAIFARIADEQKGRLDIFVANAYSAVTRMLKLRHQKFWNLPEDVYDEINNVGLRDHYISARAAAKLMVPRRHGLIVTTSSPGGLGYIFNTAYGLNKAAIDNLFRAGTGRNSSVEYSGMCIAALAADPNFMDKSGKILTEIELGKEYNLRDIDGS